jgi:acyl-CoA hydrolase
MKDTKYVTADEAVKCIETGNRVFIHGGAATPTTLVKALQERHKELTNVELVSITTLGDIDFNNECYRKSFFVNSLFVSAATRSIANSEYGDYVPVFLSEIPLLFRKSILPIDVALIHVSPPDAHGYCSLGTSVDVSRAAADVAQIIIAQVNPLMPRTHGDGFIHISRLDYVVSATTPLPEINYSNKVNSAIIKIGGKCSCISG